MMKIAYGSDIHWEFGPVQIDNPGADVLILAGDLYPIGKMFKDELFDEFIKDLSLKFEHIICIAGNHEFYGSGWYKAITKLRQYFCRFGNIHFLEDEFIDIGDVRFIGSTLWTSLDNANPVILTIILSTCKVFY
jgi:predicted phosphohydrolase